jgi:hypothetical protein
MKPHIMRSGHVWNCSKTGTGGSAIGYGTTPVRAFKDYDKQRAFKDYDKQRCLAWCLEALYPSGPTVHMAGP